MAALQSMSAMRKIIEFFKNDRIQISLGTGISILALAIFFKKVLHIEVPPIENALPALVYVGYELVNSKKLDSHQFWSRPWFWNTLMVITVTLIVVRRLYFV